MTVAWLAKIRAAQKEKLVAVGTAVYPRIPYGQEEPTPCRDCGVMPGQLHVEWCCVEVCPQCQDGQRLTCDMDGCQPHALIMHHVKPLQKGGRHTMTNVVPVCPCCAADPEKKGH